MSWTQIVGVYLPPTTLNHPPDLEEATERFWGQDPIVLGDLNVDLDEARNPRSHLVADLLMEFYLIKLMRHFRKHLHFHHLKSWTQVYQGTMLSER